MASHPSSPSLIDLSGSNSSSGRDQLTPPSEANYVSDFPDPPQKNQTHSRFYRLLSWKDPRDSAAAFVISVLFIVAGRYVNILRYLFKGLYFFFGTAAAAEIIGQWIMGDGITSRIRPKQYKTISPDSLQRFLNDFADVLNFFVVEFQRVLFAENVYVTVAAFVASVVSYILIKYVPLWGLTLIADCLAFLGPLVYTRNKEAIDMHLHRTSSMAQQRATQLRATVGEQATSAASLLSQRATSAASSLKGVTAGRIPSFGSRSGAPAPGAPAPPVQGHTVQDHTVPDPMLGTPRSPAPAI